MLTIEAVANQIITYSFNDDSNKMKNKNE